MTGGENRKREMGEKNRGVPSIQNCFMLMIKIILQIERLQACVKVKGNGILTINIYLIHSSLSSFPTVFLIYKSELLVLISSIVLLVFSLCDTRLFIRNTITNLTNVFFP